MTLEARHLHSGQQPAPATLVAAVAAVAAMATRTVASAIILVFMSLSLCALDWAGAAGRPPHNKSVAGELDLRVNSEHVA